ncbi:glycosyltransferase [Phenylobacterium sp. J426]|uniref:glycosyltransferase n=1 Tax=Phenylobacterium sp. J426 TaxID=2898439 RepID=UPI002151A082|nr:glycosyltransferase [Phenylobacterium sp. J426]MCR5876720.1 glycosyltransferase [Phenylobacterium sp. J426]
MRVLLLETDLFSAVGGGQTVYQNLVRRRADVQFSFFSTGGTAGASPPNATAIPLTDWSPLEYEFGREGHLQPALVAARRLARSVRLAEPGAAFDVVDAPDYREHALFIREALAEEGVSVGSVALALHGTISSALRGGWPWQGDARKMFAALELRERLQRQTVDSLYAISGAYAGEVARGSGRTVNLIDPLALVRPTEPVMAPPGGPPDLVFVGRREKRKGPDLFVDLVWSTPRELYGAARLIGGDGVNHEGRGGDEILAEAARLRDVQVSFEPPHSQSELRALCRGRTVLVVPSRYDQFNLVALEALLGGCPTLVSRGAGVAEWIEIHLPALAWLIVDFTCDRAAAELAARICRDYDAVRAEVVRAVQEAKLQPDLTRFDTMYAPSQPRPPLAVRTRLRAFAQRATLAANVRAVSERPPLPRDPVLRAGAASLFAVQKGSRIVGHSWARALGAAQRLRGELTEEAIVARFRRRIVRLYGVKGAALPEFTLSGSADGVRDRLLYQAEAEAPQRLEKITYAQLVASERRLERVHWYAELARLEQAAGHRLTAAVYQARILRWLGADRFSRLADIEATLVEEGFPAEAASLTGLLDDGPMSRPDGRGILDAQLARHLVLPSKAWARVEDHRADAEPKVSVIVSLYNAAAKLPGFVRFLRQQLLLQAGRVEVIFVDSGSPADEWAALEPVWRERPFPMVYARSAERETIQAAWNRALGLARGAYLVFLGVDEGVRPDGLARLARVLDDEPGVDWVMADSFINQIDRRGVVDQDVMAYVRTGLRGASHYLESTYLSYVGGMYRRTIHDRFGYYDESFRAAGDTEFKNRVLPFIEVRHLPERLGVFNDFPDARMTNHPRAEIEDIRAWYIHRTPAGMAYAFDNKPVEAAVALLRDTLSYRKAYKRELSTDIDLATALAGYLAHRAPGQHWTRVRDITFQLRNRFRRLDTWGDAVSRDWRPVRTRRHRPIHPRPRGASAPRAQLRG